ncbi:EAL domain-containing protein [Brucella tritici]|uniref:EAL domain-containing protein n=1 Tax=Brucella tritici TaxID=94626 RepID=A0A6L3Y2N2_9HYPH|nr:EAL domain-containing protein [Brucella tritici]KAB2667695.1 EAL domain-containing protein [Brucella tritici]KAB2673826.1 EAL domain-containing protein [Brucella tritici]MCH4543908.1 EAL domain-containing protein [Ochrobactrum sp. A-1]
MGFVLSDALLRIQNEILEAVAYGAAIKDVGDLLCRRVEVLSPGVTGSILLVDLAGTLRPLAGPSLPTEYSSTLEGLAIGPSQGSCGTAAFRGEPVVVTDIATDPLWEDSKKLALPYGLKACWSSPIKTRDGRVVGTFAFYYKAIRGPSEVEERIVETCTHVCSIAIEHEALQDRNRQLISYDELTGLFNRRYFNELIHQRVATQLPFGLLFADINDLKSVNDTMGHVFGDMLISSVARRISSVDERFFTCRWGGDEFAIIIDGCNSSDSLQDAAHQILCQTDGIVKFGDTSVTHNITIGGARFGVHGLDANILCQNTDLALCHAKETNRGGFVEFDQKLRTSITHRVNTLRKVDRALAEHRVLAHYQPIVELDSNEIIGLEGLARIITRDNRIVPASAFSTAFVDPQISYQITGCVLSHVATDIRGWLDAGIPFKHVGVNITTADFLRGNLEERIVRCLGKAGVSLDHIVLEVNEAVFMDKEGVVVKTVEALRKRGMLVALDDFGTGFASLTHLMTVPVDIIKIDKSFVSRLDDTGSGSIIIEAILQIGRRLHKKVVVEGIETDEQARTLKKLGCNLGQGYLFSRPVPPREIEMLLTAGIGV